MKMNAVACLVRASRGRARLRHRWRVLRSALRTYSVLPFIWAIAFAACGCNSRGIVIPESAAVAVVYGRVTTTTGTAMPDLSVLIRASVRTCSDTVLAGEAARTGAGGFYRSLVKSFGPADTYCVTVTVPPPPRSSLDSTKVGGSLVRFVDIATSPYDSVRVDIVLPER